MAAALYAAFFIAVVALSAFSVYAASKAIPPDEATGVARNLKTSSDAESPWELPYGHVVKGAHLSWAGVIGGDQEQTGCDYTIASCPIEAVVSVQAGKIRMPITTNPSATEGLILNSNRAPEDTDFPSDWHVPVVASVWYRKDQAQNTSDKKNHIAIKFNLGDQTATDSFMASTFGLKYTAAGARKFIGHSVAHVFFRAHDELGTLHGIPDMKWEVRGKNDIALSNDGLTTGYTANAAAVLADLMKMFGSIDGAADVVSHMPGEALEDLIAECDYSGWDPVSPGQARYEYNNTIRYDRDPIDAYADVARHMMGGFTERGDKVVFWTGTVRSPVMALTAADFAGGGSGSTEPVADDDWVNGYIPHRVVRTALDDDGEVVLHGEMEPAKIATDASYVTADGGVSFVKDIHFEGCDLARRARDLAHIALDTVRISNYFARYTRLYRKRALVLEVGDVYTTTDPTRLASATAFRCIAKSAPDADWNVEVTGVPYADALYDQRSVTEDEVGVLARGRIQRMPAITGLAVTSIVEGSANIQPNGKIKVDVLVEWDAITKVAARAGDVHVSWKKSSNSWPANSTPAAADETSTFCKGLVHGETYDFRARIVATVATAGRDSRRVRGDWAYLLNQVITTEFLEMDGPPSSGAQGNNRLANGNFERGDDGVTWTLSGVSSTTATGSATIESTGGKWGPHFLKTTLTAGSVGQVYNVDSKVPTPVTAGDWLILHVASIKAHASSPDFVTPKVNVLFYSDYPSSFVSAHNVYTGGLVSNETWPEYRDPARFQVPSGGDIAWAVVQPSHEIVSAAFPQSVGFDGLALRDVVVMQSDEQASEVDESAETWTTLVTMSDFPSGDEGSIFLDPEVIYEVRGFVTARLFQIDSGTAPTRRVWAQARLRIEDVGPSPSSFTTLDQNSISAVAADFDTSTWLIEDEQIVLQSILRSGSGIGSSGGNYILHLEGRLHYHNAEGETSSCEAQFERGHFKLSKVG